MQLQAYLFFEGRCEEAIEFYRRALGAEVQMLMHYKDNPEPPTGDCGDSMKQLAEKVMHASVKIGESMVLMSDGRCQHPPEFKGFSLSLTVANEAEAQRVYNALVDGGQVQMPLGKTFFSPAFGMVTDRFGVGWMVYVMAKH